MRFLLIDIFVARISYQKELHMLFQITIIPEIIMIIFECCRVSLLIQRAVRQIMQRIIQKTRNVLNLSECVLM